MSEVRVTLRSRDGNGLPVPPRTKKNSAHVRCPHEDKWVKFHQPVYAEYERWAKGCERASVYDRTAPAITTPVNCTAVVFRERAVGDLVGYLQAIADCLQVLGIVADDKHIVSWDGSRLLKDADNPRVEVTLSAIAGAQPALFGASVEETRSAAIERKKMLKAKRKALEMVGE